MPVHGRDDVGIEAMRRIERDPPVITERGIDRQPARRRFDQQALEPILRHEIEQRRRRDQIDRTVERKFEIAHQIDRARA